MMKIRIGVVTFNNTPDQLKRLLESISSNYQLANETHDFSLSIAGIDNGQNCFEDATKNSKMHALVAMSTLPSVGNIGFGRAMNLLMSQAFGIDENSGSQNDLFIAVNPDGMFHHNCLKALINAARMSQNAILEARQFPEEHPKPYSQETGDTAWATGACMAIPRKIYETIGGFDENLFMYGEDVDLSWRAKAAGFGIKLLHDAIFVHHTLGRVWSKDAKKHFFLSAVYLAHKWQATEFMRLYEDDYRARFGQSEKDLRMLATAIEKAQKSLTEIVHTTDFKPFFDRSRSFSLARWSY